MPDSIVLSAVSGPRILSRMYAATDTQDINNPDGGKEKKSDFKARGREEESVVMHCWDRVSLHLLLEISFVSAENGWLFVCISPNERTLIVRCK